MIPCNWIVEAQERIAQHITKTPMTYDPELDLYLKWENQQVTGSFKIRGAINKVISLQPWERDRGLVAASAGNHGAGVALAAELMGSSVTIFVSDAADKSKVDKMRSYGADVRFVPGGYGEAESEGIRFSEATGSTWISPYNDGQIIAGQATLGKEIYDELPDPGDTVWIIPVGGGGLMAGVACALNCFDQGESGTPLPALIGAQSVASPFFYNLYTRGTQAGVEELPSLADGLAGKIDDSSITIPLIRKFIDSFVLVSEQEISEAVAYIWDRYGEIIEGSAAVPVAVTMQKKNQLPTAVVVITGGNIHPDVHASLCTDSGVK